jgi:tetratricopeptide (TPR) repeat protein
MDFTKKKFLVIDDFFDFRLILKKMVGSLGTRDIDDADSGENAIKLMRRKAYDIVFCDYNLGEGKKDGQQILEEIKHNGLIKPSSIFIMITAENTMHMVMGAVENQPDDYLIKPVTKDIMVKRLERLMKKKADFEDIENAIQKKEYTRAISLCDENVKNNNKNMMEYLRLKSDVCVTLGRYDDAMAVYEEVLSMRDIPWAQMGLGKIHFIQGAYLKAKEIFQTIIDDNKSYMEAYDWLAKTLQELGSLEEAQQVLLTATDISPKAILRHQAIGELSYKIKDYDMAEEAFKSAIDIGKNSCYKSPSEYTGLAKSLMKKDSSEDALSILSEARDEFKGNREAILQTTVTEGIVYKETNREEDAKKAINEASRLLDSLSDKVPLETTMDLAKVCLEMGENDNDEVIKMVEDVFEDANLGEEGFRIIKSTREEIVKLNNQGVTLVKEGKIDEAVKYFEKAASGLPENKIINANAAQAYLQYMKVRGTSDQYLYRTSQYLDRVRKIDPSYEKYQKLLNMYEEIVTSNKNQSE